MVIRKSLKRASNRVKRSFENSVYSIMQKYGTYSSAGVGMGRQEPTPPYERAMPYRWIYRIRRDQSIVNNAIEEKVSQTFRRGFTDWEKSYIAKCPDCRKEFENAEPFREQLGIEDAEKLKPEDIDFSKPRPCPNCSDVNDDLVEFQTPDPRDKERAEEFWQNANEQGYDDEFLDGKHQNSIGQTVEEVCREVGLDIQSFDDGWMIFERTYWTDEDGVIQDWDLEEVHRGAPEVMRYSFSEEEQKLGHERWVCVECRAEDEDYTPQHKPGECEQCGNKRTYMAYAKRLEEPNQRDDRAEEWFIRGEFAHGSEYHPSKFYGYAPIATIWEEARTIEQMDNWYKDAYEERRAPRGALVIRSSNAQSVRTWNQEQMEALRNDPNHIPTFMDDTEGQGDPLTWQPLLEEPAAMQNMQMREWYLDRISAKFGVTAVFQSASPSPSGLSQSMEIIVSNRSAQKLKEVFEDVFIPAILTQLQVDGWERHIKRIEEEDESAEAQRRGTELRNAQLATELGREVEWTDDDKADIKPGMMEQAEEGGEGEEGGGGMMDMLGGGEDNEGENGEDVAGETSTAGGRPREANQTGGEPRTPAEPTTDNPIQMNEGGNTLTTDSEGASNPTYGGEDPETVIDLFSHIREQLEGDATPRKKKDMWIEHGHAVFDANFGAFGPEAETIKEYAEDESKQFRDLREEKYGHWVKNPVAEQAAIQLYEIHAT